MAISQGKLSKKNSKSPKITLQKDASCQVISLIDMRKEMDDADMAALVETINIGYGLSICKVQLVNMIKLQQYIQCTDKQLFDLNAYMVLHDYSIMKKYHFKWPDSECTDKNGLKTAFLKYYPKVKSDIEPVLQEFSSVNVVKGHV